MNDTMTCDEKTSIYNNRYSILAAIMLGSIMGPIDGSIINVAMPTIAQHFNVEISAAQWVPMIYLIVISSLLLFFGRLGDMLGYKKIYMSGLGGFVIASLLCSSAYFLPSIHWLVFFRAVQGFTAAMMMAVPLAIITASFPPEERGKALGINAISISAGLAIGPSLGGFITHSFGWPFVFLINLPIGCIGLFWVNRILPELKGNSGKLDFPGAITSFISLFSFALCVNYAQKTGLNYTSIALAGIALLTGAAFVAVEKRSDSPLINLGLFRNLTFSFAASSALLNFMSQYILVFLTPFFLQRLLNYPTNKVGLIMTAFPLAVMSVAPFSGALSDRIGTNVLACFGNILCAMAMFSMSKLNLPLKTLDIIWRLALFGIGTGIFQSPNNSAVMGSVPRSYLGIASGILATTRNLGMVLGVAAAGAVLYATVPQHLLQQAAFIKNEAAIFSAGLQRAYIVGSILSATAAFAAVMSYKRN